MRRDLIGIGIGLIILGIFLYLIGSYLSSASYFMSHSIYDLGSAYDAYNLGNALETIGLIIVVVGIVFIPLGYEELELNEFGKFLSNLSWFAIVDLPPFTHSSLTVFCDHHQTNVGIAIEAKIKLFDPEAPSASREVEAERFLLVVQPDVLRPFLHLFYPGVSGRGPALLHRAAKPACRTYW